jgi:hypothetical protein
MAQVKGTVINAWRKFLTDRYGDQALNAAINSLSTPEKSELALPILDSTWYPIELQLIMARLTRALSKPSDSDLAGELGRYMADYVYASVYRGLLRGKPLKDRPIDWFDDVVYRDLRTYRVEMSGPSTCIVRYHYLEGKPTSGQCRTLRAFISRKLELMGYQHVSCAHQKCLSKGNDCCEFEMQWSAVES